MSDPVFSSGALKQALNEALSEAIVADVLEDLAFGEAMREGETTDEVSRERIFDLLEGRS
ncbi:MAG: hypothetical protein AAGI91_11670 [Bacteroidota bacterium]